MSRSIAVAIFLSLPVLVQACPPFCCRPGPVVYYQPVYPCYRDPCCCCRGYPPVQFVQVVEAQSLEDKHRAHEGWCNIRGRVIWDKAKGPAPARTPIKAIKDQNVAKRDPDLYTEDWVVNQENLGIRNVVVWLSPEPSADEMKALQTKKGVKFPSFRQEDIHPSLAKPNSPAISLDIYCCRFIPHVVVAREGQALVVRNTAPVPHNAKWVSRENGSVNPLIPAGGMRTINERLIAEKFPIEIACSIHPWMNAWVRVFDHPYFAVTDKDGNFEIKDAPVLRGKLRLFIWQETGGIQGGVEGRFGQTLEVKPGSMDLGEIKFKDGK
jgi:hypothetical protein